MAGRHLVDVVERVEDPEDVDAGAGRLGHERVGHRGRVRRVADGVAPAQQHLQRQVGHGLAQRGEPLPGVLGEEAQRHVVRRPAPRLHAEQLGGEAGHVTGDVQQVTGAHPRGQERLVGVTEGRSGDVCGRGGSPAMSDTAKPQGATAKSGLRIPGFAQLQRLGKSLMLPIAVLPAAGILLRLGQDDLLGRINAPVIGSFFKAMSAAGDALFTNLPLLFAVGVAIGFARKADGSTALAAVVGYLVVQAVFKTMSPIVLAGEVDKAGDQAQINYSVFAGIVVGLVTAWLFDRYHTIQLPSYLGFFGGRRFVPIVVSLACLFIAFAMSYFYPIFDAGLTGLGKFIGGSGALGAFVYGFANRMLIPLGLHHIPNSYIWFLYGDYQTPGRQSRHR